MLSNWKKEELREEEERLEKIDYMIACCEREYDVNYWKKSRDRVAAYIENFKNRMGVC